jgi:hypothetical protein
MHATNLQRRRKVLHRRILGRRCRRASGDRIRQDSGCRGLRTGRRRRRGGVLEGRDGLQHRLIDCALRWRAGDEDDGRGLVDGAGRAGLDLGREIC